MYVHKNINTVDVQSHSVKIINADKALPGSYEGEVDIIATGHCHGTQVAALGNFFK